MIHAVNVHLLMCVCIVKTAFNLIMVFVNPSATFKIVNHAISLINVLLVKKNMIYQN